MFPMVQCMFETTAMKQLCELVSTTPFTLCAARVELLSLFPVSPSAKGRMNISGYTCGGCVQPRQFRKLRFW